MPNIKMPLEYRVDVRAPLTIQPLVTLLMEGDAQANELRVSLFDGETPLELSGLSVGGSFTRADGAEVPIKGSVESNVVKAALDEYCYAVPGPFGLYVQLLDSLGDVKRTVLLMAGHVHERGHGPVIDTGIALPSLDDILAQLETMKNVTNAANQAASGANIAAGNANEAASAANRAAGTANAAATNADAAAGRANEAAGKWTESSAEKLGQRIDNLVGSDPQTVKNTDLFGGKPPEYYLPAEQLVDNCYFKQPINQRGGTEFAAGETAVYWLDRWQFGRCYASLVDTGLSFAWDGKNGSNGYFWQPISLVLKAGSTYTACAKIDGQVLAYPFVVPSDSTTVFLGNGTLRLFKNSNRHWLTISNYTTTPMMVEWVALYEGTYTAKTLPPFVPSDPVMELAKCQRYHFPLDIDATYVGMTKFTGTTADITIPTALPMAEEYPSFDGDAAQWTIYCEGSSYTNLAVAGLTRRGNTVVLNFVSSVTMPNGRVIVARLNDKACAINADI